VPHTLTRSMRLSGPQQLQRTDTNRRCEGGQPVGALEHPQHPNERLEGGAFATLEVPDGTHADASQLRQLRLFQRRADAFGATLLTDELLPLRGRTSIYNCHIYDYITI
jgi:hypothetical protein